MTRAKGMHVDMVRQNTSRAHARWGLLSKDTLYQLKELTDRYALSVASGDIQMLEGRWYVTHAGLLRISDRARCHGIKTAVQKGLSEPATSRWVFKATVYKSLRSKGFVGYGDADPSNVSPFFRGA